jgi:flagellar hook-basal body complex protein FliE|tara:strand:+ start:192 stop:506 length:315 start_codon:yes stop_codon:yes gene_type:complete
MTQIGSITSKVLSSHKQIVESASKTLGNNTDFGNFGARMEKALDTVADAQKMAADTTRNFELGIENDLTKVMINQQISSLGFQLTLNTRNKVLSAYKDIMSMPV